jgi:hypothetical protein
MQLLPKDERISPLHPRRHCLSNKGKGLVPVKSAQLQRFPVQLESPVRELRLPKTEAAALLIDSGIPSQ